MTRPPPLPDLGTLSGSQKDELIVSLWQTIAAMEAVADTRPATARAASAPEADLRARIGRTAPSKRAREKVRTGVRSGIWPDFLRSKAVLGVMAAIGIGLVADYAIGWYQGRALAFQQRAALELENAAFARLIIELVDVAYEADRKSYRATLSMQNADPDIPLFIMLSPARAFVQTGLTWQGVDTQAAPGTRWGVVKLAGTQEIRLVFQADVDNWAELMPGYMHVRIESNMLISRSSEPKDDLVERANRFYIYLKPQDADDAAIKRRMNFPGAPPIFIPMPPH